MALLDATYKAGDTARFEAVIHDYDGSLITGLTGTIDIFFGGAKIVDAQAITPDAVRPGWYYYDYVVANAGIYSFNTILSNGHVGSGVIEVSSGDAAKETTSQAILTDTDTYLDATISSRSSHSVTDIWDELLTAATHNVPTSAGRRLRDIASSVIWTGTAQGAGANGNQIILDTGASSVDGAYDPVLIYIALGTGAGQCRLGLQYEGSTRTLTVDRTWRVNPDATSEFVLLAHPGREHVNEGLAQAGTSNTITLNPNASSIDNNYKDQIVFLRSGTGEDQTSVIDSYIGATKVATIRGTFNPIPDTTTAYIIIPTKIPDTSPFAQQSTLEAAKTVIDTNLDATVSSRSTFDSTTDTVTGTFTLDQSDFNEKMNTYYTPGSGNTPGSVSPPDNADIVRIYMWCRKKDGTNMDSVEATIELPNFQLIALQGWNAVKTEWIYNPENGLAYVDVPDTAYVKLNIKELKFKNITGYAVDDGSGTIRADQLLSALP